MGQAAIIFVFGHSQGAFALPIIIDNDKNKDIKGVIGAVWPSGKFHELMIWQAEEVNKSDNNLA
ncbi:hypothetical protein [Bacillus sp. FJAT-29937]|uniref:hypothetical protein n=1 Tax=Bacillus sp. FJAT-29937 TaxID=1720553 RepID=UPI00083706BB|nr:hypothetical protein [Bacillus sp. FJAT-29937]